VKRKYIMLSIVSVVLIAAATGLYLHLSPARRFAPNSLPIVASPLYELPAALDSGPSTVDGPAADTQVSTAVTLIHEADQTGARGFNLLLLGTDRRENEPSRTDSIILAHVDPVEKQLVVISLPRDLRINIPGVGASKLNHVHFLEEAVNGNEAATQSVIQAVSNFFGVPIHYYAKTDFWGFTAIIDTIGGVEVDLPAAIHTNELNLEAGRQLVDGATALALARERYSLANGDFGRQIDQILILKAAAERVLSPEQLSKLPRIVEQINDSIIDTNLTSSDLISLGLVFKGFSGETMKHVQLKGTSMWAMDPLVGKRLWYWVPEQGEAEYISKTYLQ
jgi:LCP family protein required for cell wall assembly